MSRYFFNFRQGEISSVDEEGCEFDSIEQAYLAAFQAAQDMWRDLLVARQDPRACAFEITDVAGTSLISLPFSEVLEACRGSSTRPPTKPAQVAFRGAIEGRNRAQREIREISTALESARATLRETVDLLARATKIESD